ncbi:MAG: 4Fe-4S binding protein [Planctomycetia bacterium]|nr:4Fe-4S binding protein [Planctomycetia bacterium]
MSTADLESKLSARLGDEELSAARLETLQIFAQMKRRPNFGAKADSIVLRKFSAVDPDDAIICRQGEAGYTAFYILTTEDLLDLRRGQLEEAKAQPNALRLAWLEREVQSLEQRAARLADKAGVNDRVAALASLSIGQAAAVAPPSGWWGKLTRALFGAASLVRDEGPRLIPIDGPSDIDRNALRAPMHEGDLFGEMSCLTRSPRSATVSVTRDWYLLEFTRDVLDQMQRDEGYKSRMDAIYRDRVLAGHLRRLSLFEYLSDAQFAELCQQVELINFQPGEIVFDEHEPSDCIYVVRSGLVKVLKNVSSLVRAEELTPSVCKQVVAQLTAEAVPDSAIGKVLKLLPAAHKQPGETAADVAAALNALIKLPTLPAVFGKKLPDILKAISSDTLTALAAQFDDDPKAWPEVELRRFNRALVAAALPGTITARPTASGPRRTLAYLTRGDFLGEMGVMSGEARSATCVAFDHPDSGQKEAKGPAGIAPPRVELVKIDAQTFHALAKKTPALQARVQQVVTERTKDTSERVAAVPGEARAPVQSSPRYEELGLFQGQKLMLIDLDRCTRCGDCVQACINTHADGRTRLYLDGPRFGRFLVPLTCRECLDPVCMIGCPVGAINRGDNGQIVIRDWCIGCSLCAEQCPYGSIQMHGLFNWEKPKAAEGAPDAEKEKEKELSRAVVCDLCSTLPGQSPACVTHCPHDAAIRIDARSEIAAAVSRR